MNAYDSMLHACCAGLHPHERDQITVQLLSRIVRICANTAPQPDCDDDFPAVQYMKAWTVRVQDVVWRPDMYHFAMVTQTESDLTVGLLRIEFDDDSAIWCSTGDVVEVPVNRSLAYEWNSRRRANDADSATPISHG